MSAAEIPVRMARRRSCPSGPTPRLPRTSNRRGWLQSPFLAVSRPPRVSCTAIAAECCGRSICTSGSGQFTLEQQLQKCTPPSLSRGWPQRTKHSSAARPALGRSAHSTAVAPAAAGRPWVQPRPMGPCCASHAAQAHACEHGRRGRGRAHGDRERATSGRGASAAAAHSCRHCRRECYGRRLFSTLTGFRCHTPSFAIGIGHKPRQQRRKTPFPRGPTYVRVKTAGKGFNKSS